jgi:hypothetical protein
VTSPPPSILLIVPYFGPLPGYAELFFRSCAANPDVHWLLVTDRAVGGAALPSNVAVERTTLSALKSRIDHVAGFEVTLPTPYKLCDFRPAYGLVFAEEAAGFDFWGHCDMDVVFGNIRHFLTADVLHAYDKVLIHGHLSLYRNSEQANNFFRLEAPRGVNYREAFTSPENKAFDEFSGVRLLLEHHGIPWYRNDALLADIDPSTHRFMTLHPPNYARQLFSWDRGRLFKEFWDGDRAGRQEYAYVHFQRRRLPPPSPALASADAFSLGSLGFFPRPAFPSPEEMDRMNAPRLLFDVQRRVEHVVWRVKSTLAQRTC